MWQIPHRWLFNIHCYPYSLILLRTIYQAPENEKNVLRHSRSYFLILWNSLLLGYPWDSVLGNETEVEACQVISRNVFTFLLSGNSSGTDSSLMPGDVAAILKTRWWWNRKPEGWILKLLINASNQSTSL